MLLTTNPLVPGRRIPVEETRTPPRAQAASLRILQTKASPKELRTPKSVDGETTGAQSKNTKPTVRPLTFRILRLLLRRKNDERR